MSTLTLKEASAKPVGNAQINQLLATEPPNKDFLKKILGQRLC
jgi:hypothetical protein